MPILSSVHAEPTKSPRKLRFSGLFADRSRLAPLLFAFVVACGATPLAGLAKDGRYAELHGKLSEGKPISSERELGQLARAVIEYDLAHVVPKEGETIGVELTACSGSLRRELKARAEADDAIGAQAKMLLLEIGDFPESEARLHLSDSDGALRALGAFVLHEPSDGETRRALFLDPDERVRRAALSASAKARDAADRDALLEVARLDPDPLARSKAYSALALIGGDELAVRLYDRYVSGDEAARFSILDAWASPGLFPFGGEGLLERAAYGGPGFEAAGYLALEAASRLAASGGPGATRAEDTLLRVAREGTTGERRLALTRISLNDERSLALLKEASESKERKIAVIAAARLLSIPSAQARAKDILLVLSTPTSDVGREARAALAAAQVPETAAFLENELTGKEPSSRMSAGRSFLRLHQPGRMAPLLADPDPSVRRGMACSLLAYLR